MHDATALIEAKLFVASQKDYFSRLLATIHQAPSGPDCAEPGTEADLWIMVSVYI